MPISSKRIVPLAVLLYVSVAPPAAAERAPEDIARVIALHRQEVVDIYNIYLNAGVQFEGKVVVRFTIAATGAVTASEVAESTTGVKLFDEAVAAAVAAWDFGPAPGEATTVLYPFTFALPAPAEGR